MPAWVCSDDGRAGRRVLRFGGGIRSRSRRGGRRAQLLDANVDRRPLQRPGLLGFQIGRTAERRAGGDLSSSATTTSFAPAPPPFRRCCGWRPISRSRRSTPPATPSSARGFNGNAWRDKLLVLIDGRTVYTPLYARRPLGHAGCAARGYRAHRSDQRTRRHAVGRQRGQWRDQHHHAQFGRHAGRAGRSGRRQQGPRRECSIRRQVWRCRDLSRLWQRFRRSQQ